MTVNNSLKYGCIKMVAAAIGSVLYTICVYF